MSRLLHETVKVGDTIETRAPAGTFTIDAASERPAVLLAGGVGITPLLAMLRHSVDEARRTRKVRPVTLIYAARYKADRAFDGELAQLAEVSRGTVRIVRVLGDATGAREGIDYDILGRIDMALLARVLPFGDYDFYLCGPPVFAQALYDGLRGLNVADDRIHAEAFGPSSLVRRVATSVAVSTRPPVTTSPVRVTFAASDKDASWAPGSGSLLDLAEAQDLSPAFGCRAGSCGTCKTKLLAGAVTYPSEPSAVTTSGEVLICMAVPAEGSARLRLTL